MTNSLEMTKTQKKKILTKAKELADWNGWSLGRAVRVIVREEQSK